MRKVTVSFDVEVPDTVDDDQVLGVMGQLIDVGLADAASTVQDDEGDLEHATIASMLEIGPSTIRTNVISTTSSPTPWGLCDDHDDGSISVVFGEDALSVATVDVTDVGRQVADLNAKLIVHAVNNYEAMKDMLVRLAREVRGVTYHPHGQRAKLVQEAEAVVLKVTGKLYG